MDFSFLDVGGAALRQATPLLLAGLGGLVSERGGVVNIALEGLILAGAWAAAAATLVSGNPYVGMTAAMFGGTLVAGLHAVVCLRYRADHVVSGVAVNLLLSAGTIFLCQTVYGQKGGSDQLGDLVPSAWFGLPPLLVIAFVLLPLVAGLLYWMPWGIRHRAVGESPEAAASAGIGVTAHQAGGVLISGALAGLAGAYLAFDAGSFSKEMAGGRGYVALAILVFGRWHPLGVLIGALVFGSARALQDVLEASGTLAIPSQFLQMLPYVVTLLALLAFGGRSRAPAALGRILAPRS